MASGRFAAAILVGIACWVGVARSAAADQSPPPAPAPQVSVKYEPPTDPKYQIIFETMSRRKVLERLQGFLAPLRLPGPLLIRLAECGGADTVEFKSGDPATICYELLRKIIDITNSGTKDENERAQVINGTFVEAALNQAAHAVFDLLRTPVWGREDDAADRLTAFIMTQFGDQVALSTIISTAKFFEYSRHAWTGVDFAELESPESQRFYNYLCIAYGADPITFHFLAGAPAPGTGVGQIPDDRAVRCEGEFDQVREAFDLSIMPYVDPGLLIKVRAAQWLMPDEITGATR
jgi:hypothetical protein